MAVTIVPRKRIRQYKNKGGTVFKEGTVVRLKPKALRLFRKTDGEVFAGREIVKAKVVYLNPNVTGLVRLDQKLGGYWTWSVEDLDHV